jgi:hypothetical protein
VIGLFLGLAQCVLSLDFNIGKPVLHHPKITASYNQSRFFVTCSSTNSKLELVGVIGAHIGLKPGKDLTQLVVQNFSNSPSSLLILDELETLWEPAQSQSEIEKLLSLLTSVNNLALMVC